MTAAPSNPEHGDAAAPEPSAASPGPDAAAALSSASLASAGSASPTPSIQPPAGGPPLGGQRPAPPPPPPPPVRAPSPDAPTAADEIGDDTATRASRRHTRHRLGGEPPARIALPNRQAVFVTLNDISHGGCCIVRKGQLELSNGDAVVIDLWTEDIGTKLSIHARVCWCSHQDASSRVGLRFVETNHRLLRQIETYVQHFHRPADDSRPRARQPEPPVRADALPAAPPADATTSRAGRIQGGRRSPMQRPLASMPRPAPLTTLDLQRRMRPAHRQEVARIAEETGIHIHTLYGWLRSLRLEGDVAADRQRDPEAWSATDKVTALLDVAGLGSAEREAYCRRRGISEEHLQRWRQAAVQANERPLLILRAEEELQRLRVRDQREIRRLQKELRRCERSVAINDELLQVVRKLQTLWQQSDAG